MPTLTIKNRPVDVFGSHRVALRLYTGPSSYPNTGGTVGDPIAASDLSLGSIGFFPSFIAFDPVGGVTRLCVYDSAAGTIRWFVPDTGAEVANGTDLDAFSADIVVYQ